MTEPLSGPATAGPYALVRVAVPVPQLDLLTYSVPQDAVVPRTGSRVVVPLGSRNVTGIVVDSLGRLPARMKPSDIKPIRSVLDEHPFLPEEIVGLAAWTAEYYACGAGEAITAVLPPKTRGNRADAHKTRRVAAITVAGLDALASSKGTQQALLALLAEQREGLPTSALSARGLGPAVVARLAARGLISIRLDRVERDPFSATVATMPLEAQRILSFEQQRALAHLQALASEPRFSVALLHGVTGSGKTEIYLRLASTVRAAGRTVLVLVPEIALTPVMASVFRGAFGSRVAIQHSGLSHGERHDQWQRIREGRIDVVVGTRSAAFAPLARLGLIVVDEEHDSSYKQDEAPRYNGRDVAIVRGQRSNLLVVLGSATPSLETYHNVEIGKYSRVTLERRVLDRPLASITVVDMRTEYAEGGPDVVLSRPFVEALHTRIAKGEQALVLLNRRGFATAMFCRECAGTIDCPHCSVTLVVHRDRQAKRVRCHYCNYSAPAPETCPVCRASYMEQSGFGTQRVLEEVERLCPGARVARLDRDAIRRKGSLASVLERFRQGSVDVLVGTQMIAKGHDYPRVTLVGVVSADVGLGVADFRAAERTFQLLTQVAGRAGRGDQPGEAIIQTLHPNHYSIQFACRQDYAGFYERELHFRRAMRYPPLVALINVVVVGRTMAAAMRDAAAIGERIRRHLRAESVRVLGPAPAALPRLRDDYRAQLLIKGMNRGGMREAVLAAVRAIPTVGRRATVDVDPVNIL